MKKAKRIGSLFLAIVMCLSMIDSLGSASAVGKSSLEERISAAESVQREAADLPAEESNSEEAPAEEPEAAEQAGSEPAEDDAAATEEPSEEPEELYWRSVEAEVTPMGGLYDDSGYPTDTVSRVWRFWHTMYDRDPAFLTSDGYEHPLTFKVSGWLPEGVTASVEYIKYNESDIYTETPLFAVELSLHREDGSPYLPTGPLTVTVGGDTLYNAIHQERPVLVYVWRENAGRTASLRQDYGKTWYAADVRAYRDGFGNEERVAYELYDKYKDYAPGQDAVRFAEDLKGITVYTDNTIEFTYEYSEYDIEEGEALPLQLVISAQNPERTVTTAHDSTDVAVSGALSKQVSVDANSADMDAYGEIAGGDALLAVDMELVHDEEGVFRADGELSVTLSDSAIADAMAEGSELELWRFDADGNGEPVEDVWFDGDSVTFETDALGAYAVVSTTLEKVLTAGDGTRYRITATYAPDAGIPAGAELTVRELTSKDRGYVGYVVRSMAALGGSTDEISAARVFDISITDPETGEEYHPEGDVAVSIELLGEDLESYEAVDVVHFGETPEVMDTSVSGEAVEFATGGFSVYVVIAHEGEEEVVTPRVEFHFIDRYPDAAYQNTELPAFSTPFNFANEDDKYQMTQILTDGETLELITDPANLRLELTDGTSTEKYFYGWYVVDLTPGEGKGDQSALSSTSGKYEGDIYFTWPEEPQQVQFEQALSITVEGGATVGSSLTWTMGDATGTAVIDEQGTAHVYLAPLYEDFYFVNFHKGSHDADPALRDSLVERRLVVFGGSDSVSVRIGDVTCESTDFQHMVFSGWEEAIKDDSGNITGYKEPSYKTVEHSIDAYGNLVNTEVNNTEGKTGYYITIQKDTTRDVKSVDLYPIFDEARWLNFHLGASGNGATYVGAAFRLSNNNRGSTDGEIYYFDRLFFTGDNNKKSHMSRRLGYTLDGWYLFANMDPSTGEITNLDSPQTVSLYYVDDNGEKHPATITTTAIKLVDADGSIRNIGRYYVDSSGNISQNASGALLFEASGGQLRFYKALDQMDLYARWTQVEDADVTVNVWRQKVTDDVYAADAEKTYDYVKDYSYTVKATSGSSLAALRTAGKLNYNGNGANVEALSTTGFHWRTTTMSTEAVSSDGTTVINVYYDRNIRTLTFQAYIRDYEYTATTADDEPQYAFIGGQWVELTRGERIGTETEYYLYRYAGTDYTGTIYDSNGNVTTNPIYPGNYYRSRYSNGTPYNLLSWGSRVITTYEWLIPEYGVVYHEDPNGSYGKVGDRYYELTKHVDSYTYNRTGYTYTRTTNNDGTQYGIVNGAIQRVYRRNNAWRLTDDWNGTQYSGYRYTQRSSTSAAYTGTLYSLIEGTAGYNQSGFKEERDMVSGDGLFGREGTNDTYFQLNAVENGVTYTYVDDNGNTLPYSGALYTQSYEQTGNQIPYPGTRYTRSNNESNGWRTVYVIEALYGQDISEHFPIVGTNGDTYAGYVWEPQNSSIFTTGDVGYIDRMQDESTFFHAKQYGTRTDNHIYYYIETLPGEAYDASYNGIQFKEHQHLTITANDGIESTKNEEFSDIEGFEQYASDPAYGSNGKVSLNNSNNYTIKLYYTRNNYQLIYNDNYPAIAGLTYEESGGKSNGHTETLPYEASLVGYNSKYTPHAPDHYTFQGWYEDAAGTVPFNFNSTMPSGDKIIYAKWSADRYNIKINPDGGEIDHVDHGGYSGFGTRDVTINGEPYTYDFTRINSSYTNYETGYDEKFQTYIRSSYGTVLSLYEPERRFVPMTEKAAAEYASGGNEVYYYVNYQMRDTDGASGIYNDVRSALYLTWDELHDFYELYRNIVIYSLGRFASSNAGMVLIDDESIWMQTYVEHTMVNGVPVYTKYRPLNSNEHWTFLGWYKDDETTPYNEQDPVESAFTLTAHWRLDGGYTIRYIPEYTMPDGAVINGEMPAWSDPDGGGMTYADGAHTKIYKEPTNLTKTTSGEGTVNITDDSVVFRGWALASATYKKNADGRVMRDANGDPVIDRLTLIDTDDNGSVTHYYYPSDPYVVDAASANSDDNRIYFQAIYQYKGQSDREPEITNLRLDANSGYINAGYDGKTPSLPFWDAYPGTSAVNTTSETTTVDGAAVPTQILFGDIQSSAALHLYKYATDAGVIKDDGYNYFTHPEGHFLLGFDEEFQADGVTLDKGTDYIATYPADSVIAVTRDPDQIIYAVWEPMVYMTFKNETDTPITFSLAPANAEDNAALEIINVRDGMYKRTKLDSYSAITLQPEGVDGDTVTFAFPQGAEKSIKISGANELGAGRVLMWDSSLQLGEQKYDTRTDTGSVDVTYSHTTPALGQHQHTLAHGEVNNTEAFDFTEDLIVNEDPLVVTFHDRSNAYALILNDNFPAASGMTSGTQEIDFAKEKVLTSAAPEGVKTYSPLPDPNSCPGYRFVGWASTPGATTADFTGSIDNLEEFFEVDLDPRVYTELVNDGQTVQRTLYAVWEEYNDSRTVYVFKNVPTPGNQTQPFTFHVKIKAGYTPSGSSSATSFEKEGDFTLRHNQYAKLTLNQNTNENPVSVKMEIRIYNVEGDTRADPTKVQTDPVTGEIIADEPDTTITASRLVDSLNGAMTTTDISVEEQSAEFYTTSIRRQSQSGGNGISLVGEKTSTDPEPLTVTGTEIRWTSVEQRGTVIYTNQRETYDVTVAKELVSKSNDTAHIFSYTASYDDEGVTTTLYSAENPFTVESGQANAEALKAVPAGVTLTVTEITDEDDNYAIETAGKYNSDEAAVTDGDSNNENAGFVIEALSGNATLTYTNTLKSYPVIMKLVDQDGNPLQARFSLTTGTVSLGTDLIADSSGKFYEDPQFWAGTTYTLKQETTPFDGNGVPYINLVGEDITLKVTGNGITSDNSWVTVTGPDEETGYYIVTVKNWKQASITVNKILNDVLLPGTRTFTFNYSYVSPVDGSKVEDTFRLAPRANDPDGESRSLRIPIRSTNFTIEEVPDFDATYDTLVTYAGGDTSNSVSVSYTDNPNPDVTTPSCTIASTADNSEAKIENDGTITFTNTRRQINLTVKKIVSADDTSGSFAFTATLYNGNNGIPDYAIDLNGTSDSSDDQKTQSTEGKEGQYDFTLQHDGEKVLTIPVGARLTIQETGVTGNENGNTLELYETTTATTVTGSSASYSGSTSWNESSRLYTLTTAPSTALTVTFTNGSGIDIKFKKVDGFGNPLPDATFSLYKDYACKTALEVSGEDVTGKSDSNGVVAFSKIPNGVYYMKETTVPSRYTNTNTYIVLVGDKALAKEGLSEAAAGYLANIETTAIAGQTAKYKTAYGTDYDKYAIFLIDSSTEDAVTTPDIAAYGIMNISTVQRKAIIRKVNSTYASLQGAKFDLLRYDMTVVESGLTSAASGVIWIGELPLGTYYLHETKNSAGNTISLWYTVTVDENGTTCSQQSTTQPTP